MIAHDLMRLRELTESITSNGYLKDQAVEWGYALDAIPDYIYIVNVKSKLRFINKSLANKLGIDPNGDLDDICIDDLLGFEVDNICKSVEVSGEATINKHGMLIPNLGGYFNISRTPIYTDTYKLIGFICILQPTTKCDVLFKEVNHFLKPFLDSIPAGMCVVNLSNNKIVYTNDLFEKALGHSKEELNNMDINDLFMSEKENKLLNEYTKVIEIPNSNHYLIIIQEPEQCSAEG